jgi:hypothetical protein
MTTQTSWMNVVVTVCITPLHPSGQPSTQQIWVVTWDLSANGVMPHHRFPWRNQLCFIIYQSCRVNESNWIYALELPKVLLKITETQKEKLFCKPRGHGKTCHIPVWKVHVLSCLAHELSHLKLGCNQCIQARKSKRDVVTCVYEWFKKIG